MSRVQPLQTARDVGLDAVIGMYPTVHRARATVVTPWTARSLGDPAVRPPASALVHGPHGCGATFIAHRLADELGHAADVPAVVMEQVDDLAADGPDALTEALSSPAFADVVVIGVSHRPWDVPIDGAGFDRLIFVPPPDWDARRFRLWETPAGSSLDVADLDRLVVATERWSGVDLAALGAAVRSADELLAVVEATEPTSLRWLAEARDLVRRHGPHGRLDDVAGYLQRYRLL